MKKLTKLLLVLGASLWLLPGCVDKNYDLDNGVSKDMLLAKNGLFLPLGASDNITLQKLMKNANITGLKVENGNYSVVYGDSLLLNVPTQKDIKINDLLNLSGSASITGSDLTELRLLSQFPLPRDISYNLNQNIGPFTFQTSSEVQRLDSVSFNTDGNNSRINITINTKDLNVASDDPNNPSMINLSLHFPSNYTLIDPSNGKIVANNTYNVSYPAKVTTKDISLILSSFRDTQKSYTITAGANVTYKKGAQIVVGANPSFNINMNFSSLLFKQIYGLFNIKIASSAGQTSFKGLYDFITGKDNTLSFSQPRIFVTSTSNVGIPINVDLKINAVKNASVVTSEQASLSVKAPSQLSQIVTNRFGLGPQAEAGWTGEPWKNIQIGDLLKGMPDALSFDINASSDISASQHFYTDDAFMKIKYEAKVPLAVASDFKVTLADTVRNVFTKDIVDHLFSSGNAEVYGLVTNSIPLNVQLSMRILDENNNDTGVSIAPQVVTSGTKDGASTSTVLSIKLSESEVKKMQNAKNVELVFVFTSSDTIKDITLKQSDYVSVTLYMKKDGGINLNM